MIVYKFGQLDEGSIKSRGPLWVISGLAIQSPDGPVSVVVQ